MWRPSAVLLAGGALLAMKRLWHGAPLICHVRQEHPIELVGTVTSSSISSPHVYILLDVKDQEGTRLPGSWKAALRASWSRGWSVRSSARR